MGYLFLFLSKIATVIKMIAVKNCGNIASGPRNSIIINLIRSLGCIAVSLVVCLASGFSPLDSAGTVISVFAGISNGIVLFVWILAANKVSLCTVETFCMAGAVIPPLIVSPFIFEGETVSVAQWIGSVLLFGAMYCLSKGGKKSKMSLSAFVLLVVCTIGNSCCALTKKLFTSFSESSTEMFQLYTFVFVFITFVLIFPFVPAHKASESPKFTSKVSFYILIAVIMLYLVEYLSTLSSGYLPSAVYYPLSYVISMPMTFIADVIFFKEKITFNNVIGILLVTLSGILINF